jgi:hypothetical protein
MDPKGSLPGSQVALSWARSIQSMPHPISWRSILIVYPHPHVGLPSGLFLLIYQSKRSCESSSHATKALASSWPSNIHLRDFTSPWLQFCLDLLTLLLALHAPCISSYLMWSLIVPVREHKLWSLTLCTSLHSLVTANIIVSNIPRVAVHQSLSPYLGRGKRFFSPQKKCPDRLWCPPSLLFNG